jgi:catechol 2,3-dioxygenase-like lactoylglutathione lyase family enzyme
MSTRKGTDVAPKLSMVGLVVEDMARSLAFYRRLGVELPEGAEELPHV